MALVILCLTATPLASEPARILAIGDSVLAWHKWTGRDIPSVMGRALGAVVENGAVAGAQFSNPSARGRAVGRDVRAQFRAGPWDIVLINGGANDLLNDCGCGACSRVLDALIADDLSGEVPRFLAGVLATGAEVVWMGYYASNRSGQFTGCRPYLVEYDKRLARLAGRTERLTFLDSETVMNPEQRGLYALDGIHPSPRGARRIGTYLAQSMSR
jgi:lysophospholipase L1-like esterase